MPACKELPIVSPHGHTDPRWYARERAISRSGAAADRSRPLCLPHAVQPGRPAGGSRRADGSTARRSKPTGGRSGGASPRTSILFRGTPTRLWFDYVLSDRVRHRRAAERRQRRLPTTTAIAELPGPRRIPPARAVRALQHRGDRHHRRRARRSALAQDDPRQRLERARRHRLPARCRGRSGFRGISRQSRPAGRDHRLRYRHLGRLSRRPPRAPGLLQVVRRDLVAITATRPRRPRTFPMQPRRNCSTACGARTSDERENAAVPRPDADRNGEDEPRRRAGAADPSGLMAQPFAGDAGKNSAATRASISRPAPTM